MFMYKGALNNPFEEITRKSLIYNFIFFFASEELCSFYVH